MRWLSLALLFGTFGCDAVSARRRIQEGNKAYYAGKYEQAIVDYEEALAGHPELVLGWFNLGLSHLALFSPGAKSAQNQAHAQGAIAAFQTYLAAVPTDTKARDYLLSTFIDSGHYEGALEYFEAELAAHPADVQAVAQLAQINAQAGKYEEAIRWHRKRAELESTSDANADAWYALGVTDWRRLNNHLDVTGLERAKIADEDIAALERADKLRGGHQASMTYLNLLYRERSLAHDASYARAVDLATAQLFYKKATDIARTAEVQKPAAKPTGVQAHN